MSNNIELKAGDVVRLKKMAQYSHKHDGFELYLRLEEGSVVQVRNVAADQVTIQPTMESRTNGINCVARIDIQVDVEDVELLQPIQADAPEEPEQPDPSVREPEEKPDMEPFAYSHFIVKRGQRTPRAMLYQATANKLAEVLGKPDMAAGTVDGITGQSFTDSSTAVQEHFYPGKKPDNKIGSGTWGKMTGQLGDWRPPLRWRIAEQQNSFENCGRQNAFGAWNIVGFEGWPNYGIWNCNCMDGNMAGSSIGILLAMAGRKDLWKHDPERPEEIADFLASKPGRKVQLHDYMNKYVIGPAIRNLKIIGIDIGVEDAENLPDTLNPWNERILALACDFAVNSGQVGQFSSRFPRIWDGKGLLRWENELLPDQDACIAIYEEVYGIKVTSKTSQYNGTKYPRDKSREAMRRCVQEVAWTDEEGRINLIADLQARCIYAKKLRGPETLQELIIRRRRCVARLGGFGFQGTHYDTQKDFGIGL